MTSHFTDHTAARTAIARALLEAKRAQLLQQVGLLREDLLTIQTKGEQAQEHDRLQRDELAAQKYSMDQLSEDREKVDAETQELRSRLPAVVLDLAKTPSTAPLATWLATVSFERFRVRELSTTPTTTGTPATETKPERERVARSDRLSRAQSTAQFATSILETERAPIIEALSKRGMNRDRIQALAKSSQDVADKLGGKIQLTASSHTQLEANAVDEQTERWKACRRMIRRAVQGDPELTEMWAKC